MKNKNQKNRRKKEQNNYQPNAFANYGVRKTSIVQNDNEEYSKDDTYSGYEQNHKRTNRTIK